MSFISERSATVAPFRVMKILGAAHKRDDALVLCVGQPATSAPTPVIRSAHHWLDAHTLGYTPTLGIPELRQKIAEYHNANLDNVVVTTGSSGAFVALFLAVLDPGDTIVMTRPGYPAYRNTLAALGAHIIDLPCGPDTRFQPTVDKLAHIQPTPKAVIVTSPDNPTGTIIDPEELRRIAHWCEEVGCLLISDEIYHGISYGRPCASARDYPHRAVTVGSLSKYFSMTGWRLGWLIVPDDLVEPLENLEANLAPNTPPWRPSPRSRALSLTPMSPTMRGPVTCCYRNYPAWAWGTSPHRMVVFTSILISPTSPMIRNNGATSYCMTPVWPSPRG